MTSESTDPKTTAIVEVSPDTKALVDEKMTDEPDEIKQHMMALVEAIKKRATTQLESTEEMTRESYVSALQQAKETLNKTEDFFHDRKTLLEQSIDEIENTANQRWESLVQEMKEMGDRLDRAVSTAWKILTEPSTEPEQSDSQKSN
jgi:Zn-dependent oligopeptidase